MDALHYLLAGGGLTALGILARQLRLIIKDVGERRLARHIFDQTRSLKELDGYTRLAAAQRSPQGRAGGAC